MPRRNPVPDLSAILEVTGAAFPGHAMRRLRRPDGSFRYTYASPHLRQSFGLDVERILAQDPATHDWVHDDDRPRLIAALHASGDGLTPFDEEVRVLTPGGGQRWVRSLSQPRRLADGTVIWDGIALDVTERRDAMEALTRAMAAARAAEARGAWPEVTTDSGLAMARAEAERLVGLLPHGEARRSAERLVTALAAMLPAAPSSPPDLTGRQRQVLMMLSEGLTNAQIGQRLGVAAGTAKLHVAAVLRRLGLPNRAAAAAYAARGETPSPR
jgi:PAS domain S-box-containing protein